MSAIYGRLSRQQASPRPETVPAAPPSQTRLITAVAALIPADVLAIHALVLTWTTKTESDGATTITNEPVLAWSLWILLGLSLVLYLIGRGTTGLGRADVVRALIPGAAFLAWAALVGTSVLTPWVAGIDRVWLLVAAAVLAAVLIPLSDKLNPAT